MAWILWRHRDDHPLEQLHPVVRTENALVDEREVALGGHSERGGGGLRHTTQLSAARIAEKTHPRAPSGLHISDSTPLRSQTQRPTCSPSAARGPSRTDSPGWTAAPA